MNALGHLRTVEENELELMRAWRNAPSIRANMYTRHEISQQEHLDWWQRTLQRDDQKYFMYEKNKSAMGIVGFTKIDRVNSNCSWAFYASTDAVKGTGSRMEYLALEHVFNDMRLHKLYCEVLSFNLSVISMHKKFGFAVEGVFRQHHMIDGEYIDVVRMGFIVDEWLGRRNEMRVKLERTNRGH